MADNQFTPEELTNEKWLDIPGYEGVYQVSNIGRIKRVSAHHGRTRPNKILRPADDGKGYLRAVLCNNGVTRTVQVHRMVAAAFLGPCAPGRHVHHKDYNPSNNRAVNLEYVTPAQNIDHSRERINAAIPRGERHRSTPLSAGDVRRIRELYSTGKYTQSAIAKRYGISFQSIGAIVRRETWKHTD